MPERAHPGTERSQDGFNCVGVFFLLGAHQNGGHTLGVVPPHSKILCARLPVTQKLLDGLELFTPKTEINMVQLSIDTLVQRMPSENILKIVSEK